MTVFAASECEIVRSTQSSAMEGRLDLQESTSVRDAAWDSFLEQTPQGHFQQSSMWAASKAVEGWEPIRVRFVDAQQLLGGFQVLARRSRMGRIGYISKGPVLVKDDPGLQARYFDGVRTLCRRHGLRALIVQPPDSTTIAAADFRAHGYAPNELVEVIKASMVIDLRGSWEDVEGRIRKTARVEVRQAERRGMKIREGKENEAGLFFKLMAETCARQGTAPSPGSEAGVQSLLSAFSAGGRVRVSFAEYEGEPVAGALCLMFGDRVTLWKKGWSGAHRERHPNALVTHEAIQWAHAKGYKRFDCAGMSHVVADRLLRREELSEAQKRGRDFFLLGYGAQPVLLPGSWVYFRNPAARFVYARVASSRFLAGQMKRFGR
jgi:peptidoglycan pentaglycine glycine transferase (the first glycine)